MEATYLIYAVDFFTGQRSELKASKDTKLEALQWVRNEGDVFTNYEILETYKPTKY